MAGLCLLSALRSLLDIALKDTQLPPVPCNFSHDNGQSVLWHVRLAGVGGWWQGGKAGLIDKYRPVGFQVWPVSV